MKRALLLVTLLLAGCGVQPSDPIPGSQATGALIYLIKTFNTEPTVTPILRTSKYSASSANQALDLLAGTSTEGMAPGFRNDVPREAQPMTLTGSTVTMPIDVTSLSTLATQQIACTAATPGPVTLVGGGQTRGPVTCPI